MVCIIFIDFPRIFFAYVLLGLKCLSTLISWLYNWEYTALFTLTSVPYIDPARSEHPAPRAAAGASRRIIFPPLQASYCVTLLDPCSSQLVVFQVRLSLHFSSAILSRSRLSCCYLENLETNRISPLFDHLALKCTCRQITQPLWR